MATRAATLVAKVAVLLSDQAHDRWSELELVSYLAEAEKEVVVKDATANLITIPHKLAVGVEQCAPDDCHELLNIDMNLGREWVAGTNYQLEQTVYHTDSAGNLLRYRCVETHLSTADFDADALTYWQLANFASGTYIDQAHEANVHQYGSHGWGEMNFENVDIDWVPLVSFWARPLGLAGVGDFMVSPPQPEVGRMYVRMKYSQIPPPVGLYSNITVSDKYEACLIDYMLFRAYSRDMDTASNETLSQKYFMKFEAASVFRRTRR